MKTSALILASSAIILSLAACSTIEKIDMSEIEKTCNQYCKSKRTVATVDNSGVFIMMKNMADNSGGFVRKPTNQIFLKHQDPDSGKMRLMSPSRPSYGNLIGTDQPTPMDKSVNLNPDCFSKENYEPTHLNDIDLNKSNTTISLINFREDGRLESLELDSSAYSAIENILTLSPSTSDDPEYIQLQELLSGMRPQSVDNAFALPSSSLRNLINENVPVGKTPFYSDLTTNVSASNEGHVYFYVLVDENLMFMREHAALVTYAPEVTDTMMELYTPFAQYPPYPEYYDNGKMDVLTFHFKQGPGGAEPGNDDDPSCSYIYDLHVVAGGQDESGGLTTGTPPWREHSTPLAIDPEIKTEGVVFGDDG